LSDIILRNTSITNLQDNVFFMPVPEPSSIALALFGTVELALLCYDDRERCCLNCDRD
jgi:hypothetical protein